MALSTMLSSLLIVLALSIISSVPQASACGTACPSPPKQNPPSVGPIPLPPVIGKPPITLPPVIGKPPITIPPVIPVIGKPPITIPPVIPVIGKPPITIPPVIPVIGKPPITIPPIKPPVTIPPVITPILPPVVTPPVIKPPVLTPPSTKPCPPGPKHPSKKKCPVDTVKLGACLNLLGTGLIHIGDPAVECCPLLEGLVDAQAALCLCTAIKVNMLGLKLYVPIALELLLTCGKKPPPGFKC